MIRITKYHFVYFVALFCLIVLGSTDVRGQGSMYGPLNLYSDIYWGTDGRVYATSQVTPSVSHYSHQYRAQARITASDGSSVTNTSSWTYNSASTLATYDFVGVSLDGLFTNDSEGVGWCGIVHQIFATLLAQRQTTVPTWVKLANQFGNFDPTAINGSMAGPNSTNITISYSYSLNAAGKTFTVSFGVTLGGMLIVEDIGGSGSGEKTVSGPPVITATYTSAMQVARSGTIKASVSAYSGTATVMEPFFVGPSSSEANVN